MFQHKISRRCRVPPRREEFCGFHGDSLQARALRYAGVIQQQQQHQRARQLQLDERIRTRATNDRRRCIQYSERVETMEHEHKISLQATESWPGVVNKLQGLATTDGTRLSPMHRDAHRNLPNLCKNDTKRATEFHPLWPYPVGRCVCRARLDAGRVSCRRGAPGWAGVLSRKPERLQHEV